VIFGQTIHRYDTVASTQDIAKEKALGGEPAGTVIAAAYQTGGRGRRGRSWFAPRGANVCMTVIGPPVALADAWQIALVAGIAVAEGIRSATGTTPTLRFPNDILLEGQKLSGILVETVPHPTPGRITPLIGIGVNVNIPEALFPEDLRARSTSLLRVTGAEHSVPLVQRHILDRLGIQWDAFTREPPETAILPRWHALADREARRTFVIDNQPVSCRVHSIAADGTLTLETSGHDEHKIHASHVIFGDD
jgi:BirA family biotin operon repressor/biotin-[acetyl-CoA-carboxylase] ligase